MQDKGSGVQGPGSESGLGLGQAHRRGTGEQGEEGPGMAGGDTWIWDATC